jgi:hypothetical protein
MPFYPHLLLETKKDGDQGKSPLKEGGMGMHTRKNLM